ncbi:tripartite tricarboxylate transporter substrate binding protein [Limnohabitans sp. Rim8]|uniref:Bug family tripartite tricarboxylate transporter substrate binding protein n=1 Tax=Limnohabitans sp. Rim8 TaxID=1100718 RepID=UPI0025CCC24E|nr:Bug family tripartite tricarboxylate transporter substrate binding protein [Limnohabitans sp. Rim8]
MNKKRIFLMTMAAALAGSSIGVVAQQSAPILNKPLKIVVGFPPGGSADTLARALAQQLTGIAPSVIVDNKPGAGGRIALEAVKNSEADGATLVMTPASMVAVYPHIYRKLPYDPVTDFAPVGRVAAAPFIVAVGPQVPLEVKTLADFIKWGKANPTLASYGSSGAGSIPHFTGVALGKTAGLDWSHVAYKGAAPAMNDLLGGHIAANVSVMSNALPHVQAGKLRALAVSSSQRNPALASVPTFAEAGLKEAAAVEWFGVFAPARTPADVVARLSQALNAAERSKPFQDALAKGGFDSVGVDTPITFANVLKADIQRWGQIVRTSGFTPED